MKLEDIKESLDLTKFIPPGVFVKEIDNNIVEKNIEIKEEKLTNKKPIITDSEAREIIYNKYKKFSRR